MINPQSATLVEALTTTFSNMIGNHAEDQDLARTLITRGPSWMDDDEKLAIACQKCAYAATMGVGDTIKDGAVASGLLERSLDGFEVLKSRNPQEAEGVLSYIDNSVRILRGEDTSGHLDELLRKLPNSDLSHIRARLDALKSNENG